MLMDNSGNAYVALNIDDGVSSYKFQVIKITSTAVDAIWSVNSNYIGVPRSLLFED